MCDPKAGTLCSPHPPTRAALEEGAEAEDGGDDPSFPSAAQRSGALCSSFGQDTSQIGEATGRCGFSRPGKPVWLFLAFFLKTLRNSEQVAPVGSPQPWPLGGILAHSSRAPLAPAPRRSRARERQRGHTIPQQQQSWELSSQSSHLLTHSGLGKQPPFDACRLGSSLGHFASLEKSPLPNPHLPPCAGLPSVSRRA